MRSTKAASVLRCRLPRALAGSCVLAAGCSSPIADHAEGELRRSVLDSVQREVAEAQQHAGPRETSRDFDAGRLDIRPEHLEEIEREYNPGRYFSAEGDASPMTQVADLLSEDLYGRPQRVVSVGLRHSVRTALERNLLVQETRFAPAVSESQVVRAAAAFDWVFFGGVQWQDTDTPQAGPGFLGLDRVINADQTVSGNVGVRRSLVSGGTLEFRQNIIYQDVRESAFGVLPSPNPSSSVTLSFEFSQPLLRGFGSDVALADLRIAQNAERGSIQDLRSDLITTVTDVERAYWDLVSAHRELVIAAKLLERGEEVRDNIRARLLLDAVQAQVADAVSTVEARRGDVLRAQTRLRRASDALKALVNDPRLPVGSEVLLIPADTAIDEPISFSLVDAVQTAVDRRPEVQRAILAIDDASIREVVADNARLPLLDFTASASLLGFDGNTAGAFDDLSEREFLDNFLLGLVFEQPIGNRAGEAGFRGARLERMRAVTSYRRAVQGVVLDVKNALDEVVLNYKLIEQTRTSRIAAAEALRTFLVEKELTVQGFTVERLDLEFNQQDALAAAERAEIAALVNYNTSIADLYAAMGTALERNRIDLVVPDANQLLDGELAIDYAPPPRRGATR